MLHITVDDEQARIISGALGNGVEILNRHGQRLGYVTHGVTEEDIAIAKQRRAENKPGYTIEQVMEHLESLEQSLERK